MKQVACMYDIIRLCLYDSIDDITERLVKVSLTLVDTIFVNNVQIIEPKMCV